jgi:hypothetical protein
VESLEAHGDPIPEYLETFEVEMGEATEAVVYSVVGMIAGGGGGPVAVW